MASDESCWYCHGARAVSRGLCATCRARNRKWRVLSEDTAVIAVYRKCPACGKDKPMNRIDQVFCSAACRQWWHRNRPGRVARQNPAMLHYKDRDGRVGSCPCPY